ncbi:MAG: metallophosphoesterase family protein [Bacteroidota bacterium]
MAGWILLALLVGCAHVGRLGTVGQSLAPVDTTGGYHPERSTRHVSEAPLHALFGEDTLIGFQPGTGDSARRYLGRLRDGYTADTLNVILIGDNRPGYRTTRLAPQLLTIRRGLSLNPIRIGKALITIPYAIVKGLWPDLGLFRDIPPLVQSMPTWGREHQVLQAVMAKLDTLKSDGRTVAAVINTGDLVYDGSRPAHWERFLRITRPLSSRVPYFAVAGNHEKTWTVDGLANWRAATGLPIGGDRMYYCFDSADGWMRFIALDSNPITMPGVHWSKDVQVKYSKEEVDWMVARLKEHRGPAFVFIHSPPFSAGAHRDEWESDPVMRSRRDEIITAMHKAGISVLAAGHEHAYERALLTFPDGSVMVNVVQGGAGAPLHPLPAADQAAQLFGMYQVAGGARFKPENVYSGSINNFTFIRLWFGGGELQTFAVYKNGSAKLVDHVNIDLKRYGVPKIDQHKIPIPPTGQVSPSTSMVKMKGGVSMKADTTAASQRIEKGKPPGKKKSPARPVRKTRRPAGSSPGSP